MAKIRKEHYSNREQNLHFKYDINIDAGGTFYTYLPDNIVQLLENGSIVLGTHRKKNGYIEADSISELIDKVNELFKELYSTTIVSENIIIRYCIQTQCTYVIGDDGEIGPNGNYTKDNTDGKWKGGTENPCAGESVPYGLQVFVRPLLKRILRYKSGKMKTEYTFVSQAGKHFLTGKQHTLGKNGKWLEDIVGIGPIGKQRKIEYTEETALFFVNMIKSICMVNERIKDYLEPEQILLMMANGTKLLN